MHLLNPTLKKARRALAGATLTGLALVAASASAVEVTGSFTGWYGTPELENHGVILTISELPGGDKTGVVFWSHYDDVGNPSWLFAQGPVVDNTVQADIYRFEGVTFMQPDDPDNNPGEQIGTMEIRFDSCLEADVSFETIDIVVGTGGFRIFRLSNQPGMNCSGGISDNTPPTSLPEEFRVFLAATGAIPGASGKVDFESRPGRAEFSVEIEDLPIGDYELQVGGQARGTITVASTDDGNEGELEFRSPAEPGKILLDFDPRGQIIEVLQAGTVILEGVAPDSGDLPGAGDGNPPAFGSEEIEVDLVNDGVFPQGSGEAEFEQESNRVEFDVEIEDVPIGSYTLLVGGVERGTIDVIETLDGPEGELEFRFPAEPGKLPLDFDPRDQLIEIFDGAARIFFVQFPAQGGDDDDDNGGDDGDDGDNGEDDGDDGSDDDGSTLVSIEVDLTNTGVFPAGSGDAVFEERTDRSDFDVQIEDVPVGDYVLSVGGVERGVIAVAADGDGQTEGEIVFRSPVEPGKLPLEFDPRGQLVEVLDGATVIFAVDFPNT
ncbi:MAG: hypothetical protein RQ741_10710 [Wenzhouxiangellaceae bacterium]|nr:hypothetical protein [Wenzhouxiangellaceae bacterium]